MMHGAQRRILWLALVWCFLAHITPLHAQPLAPWWYPDGTPEATNRSILLSKSQVDSQLVIRWRTTALRGTPTVLVGAIRSRALLDSIQEVVGLMGDTLVILSSDGTTLLSTSYRTSGILPAGTPYTLRLTGLFNPALGSFFAGRPSYIGIGVEREQTTDPGDSLWAFLADSSGKVAVRIALGRIADTVVGAGRRSAGVYPVAAYRPPNGEPNVIALITQDERTPGILPRLNSVQRHTMEISSSPVQARLHDGYPVAPKTYPASPSLFSDGPISTIGLATSPYSSPPDTVRPLGGTPTQSDAMYSIALVDRTNALQHLKTHKMPPAGNERPAGFTRSYVLTLYEAPNVQGSNYRLIAENHGPNEHGTPRLQLIRLEIETDTAGDTTLGEFTSGQVDHGWKVVAADVDGGAVNTGFPQKRGFPNNTNDEIIAAHSLPGDPDINNNELHLLRLNETDVDGNGGKLLIREFVRQPFSGRLMCAGDLAVDAIQVGSDLRQTFRQEIVVANGSRVSVLRFLPYLDPRFGASGNYFETVRTFDLDSRVLDCAIADLDGDQQNELVVVTEQATYAIGLPHPHPFVQVRADTTTVCAGTPLTLRWNRRVGGGEEGVLLSLLGLTGEMRLGVRDTSTTGSDSLTFQTGAIPAGTYRLRIGDSLVPNAADSSLTITIRTATIGAPTASAPSITLDSTIRLTAHAFCPDRPLLLRSIEGGAWDTLSAAALIDDSLMATAVITCTPAFACFERDSVLVSFKFVDPTQGTESPSIPVIIRLPRTHLALEPGDTSRARTREVRWRQEDFPCTTLDLSLSADSGRTWQPLGTIPADRQSLTIMVPDQISADSIELRLCCSGNMTPGCAVASVAFEIEPAATANYISPNPFNPLRGTARIVYRLNRPSRATATILDAGRGVVARLTDETGGGEAGRRSLVWDGRTSRGGIVATGSYICLIESDGGESILIPFYVMQR